MKRRVFIECTWCGKQIERRPSEVKERNYCNYECRDNAKSFRTRFTGDIPRDYYHEEKGECTVCSYREFIDTYETLKIKHIKEYSEIFNLRHQGVKIEEISKRTGIEQWTVQSYVTKKNHPSLFTKIEKIGWLPLKGSKELAYVVGFMIGDGHIDNSFTSAIFSNTHKELLEIINDYLENIFGKKQKIVVVETDYFYRIVTDAYIARALTVCGIQKGNKNYGNSVPKWIKDDKNYLRYFLAGLLDAEGTISRQEETNKCTSLKISMCDKKFIEEIRKSFHVLDIETGTVTPRDIIGFSTKEYTIYELSIYREKINREKFYKLIPIEHPKKKENLELIIKHAKKNMRAWSIAGNTSVNHTEESCSNQEVRNLPFINPYHSNEKYDIKDVKIIHVKTLKERQIFNKAVSLFHSYKQSTQFVGRRINWLIMCKDECIGTTGLGSSVMAIGDRDKYIGWNKEQRFKNLVKTANNWRFTIKPDAPKNTGSKVLSMMVKEGSKLWYDKYGDKLVLLETLVEKPHTGLVYIASGWTYVGETKGTEFRWMDKEIAIEFVKNNPNTQIKQKFMKFNNNINKNKYEVCITNNKSKKSIFVKPLHRYWRKELQRMD